MKIHLGGLLLLGLLALVFFARLVVHPTQVLYSDYSDFLPLHLASKRFLVRSWQETGELPLWCPYNFAGMPFLADIQVSAFYPLHWVLFLLPEESIGAALSWLVVLHVLVAGVAMYAYARYQGLQGSGALVAALGYMFAGKWLLHILSAGHYNMVPLAWLPLVLLGLETAIRRGSLVAATWAGVAFALFPLGAYPYVTLYAGLFVAIWTLGTCLEEAGYLGDTMPRSRERTVSALLRWAGLGAWTALVAVGLGAVQLLPGLDISGSASRSLGVFSVQRILLGGVHSLVGLVGEPPGPDSEWLCEDRGGLGLLWLTAAVLSVMLVRGRVRFEGGVCLLLLGFVLGGAVAVQWLPGFRLFQLPSRILLLAAFPVALLAGRATQALFAETGPELPMRLECRRALLKLTALVIALAGFYGLTLLLKGEPFQMRAYWFTLLLTVPAAWWLLGQSGEFRGRWAEVAWVTILVVDLWALTWPLVAVRPEAEVFAPSACVRYLAEQREKHGRAWDFNSPGTSANSTPLWPGLPMVQHIEPVRGFNPIDVLRYKEYLQMIQGSDEPLRPLDRLFTSALVGTFPLRNPSLADLLGVRYILQPVALPLESWIPDPTAQRQWQPVFDDPEPTTFNFIPFDANSQDCGLQALPPYRVYENTRVLPRAFVVPRAEPLPERSQVFAALCTTDFRQKVLLEDWQPAADIGTAQREYRPGRIVEYRPNRVVVAVDGAAPGYLVLADVWFPGWQCMVDDQPAAIHRANFLFRGVILGEGAQRVVFTFAPASYDWGKRVSGATVLLVLGLTALAPAGRWWQGRTASIFSKIA